MLRYLEGRRGWSSPRAAPVEYRRYGIRELNQLNALADLRARFDVGAAGSSSSHCVFGASPHCGPQSRRGSPARTSRASDETSPAWVEWEQRKHERLLTIDAA